MDIEDKVFIKWMQEIMKRFDLIENYLKENKPEDNILNEKLLDTADLSQLLRVSPRTLRKYRDKGIIPFLFIKGRCYYRESDIKDLIKSKLKK